MKLYPIKYLLGKASADEEGIYRSLRGNRKHRLRVSPLHHKPPFPGKDNKDIRSYRNVCKPMNNGILEYQVRKKTMMDYISKIKGGKIQPFKLIKQS